MDPLDQLRTQREFEGTGLDVIGIYHSHPDHPSRPSETDKEKAHEGYSYVIISVRQGTVASVNSWILKILTESKREFYEELLVLEGEEKK